MVIGFRNVRQLFGIELFSVVILIKLISEQTSFNAVWCRSVSIVAASAIVLHMAFVIPCAKRSHAQFQDIVTTYLHSEDGVVSFRYEEFPVGLILMSGDSEDMRAGKLFVFPSIIWETKSR